MNTIAKTLRLRLRAGETLFFEDQWKNSAGTDWQDWSGWTGAGAFRLQSGGAVVGDITVELGASGYIALRTTSLETDAVTPDIYDFDVLVRSGEEAFVLYEGTIEFVERITP